MTDARAVLASLRPQGFGTGRPDRVSDPIVEPLWAGIRALAALDRAGATLTDESGDPIEDQPGIVRALAAAAGSSGLVLDGFLTKQAAQDGIGVTIRTDVVPALGQAGREVVPAPWTVPGAVDEQDCGHATRALGRRRHGLSV